MRLLVAFDGSEGALAALQEAAALARETSASVIVLRVLNPLVDAADVVAPSTDAAMLVVTERARASLSSAIASAGLDVASVEIEVVECDRGEDVAEVIERVAGSSGATMIVISSRRAASISGAVMGSVTDHVLRNAPCPVLVVPE